MQPSSRNKKKLPVFAWTLGGIIILGLVFYLRSMSAAQSAVETQTAIAESTAAEQTAIAAATATKIKAFVETTGTALTARAVSTTNAKSTATAQSAATETAFAPTENARQTQRAEIDPLSQLCRSLNSSPVVRVNVQGPIWFVRNDQYLDLSSEMNGYAKSVQDATTLACIYDEPPKVIEVCTYVGSFFRITRKAPSTTVHLVDIVNRVKVAEILLEGNAQRCPGIITTGPGSLPPPTEIHGFRASFQEIADSLKVYWSP